MAKDKLSVMQHEDYGYYYIQWELEDGLGAILGNCESTSSIMSMQNALRAGTVASEDVDHYVASVTAWLCPTSKKTKTGLQWDTKDKAKSALALIKAKIKEYKDKRPWPEWALSAIAHGWKAPKGWQP